MLVQYMPGNATWTGLLNVNEGLKKGLISVLEELQKKSTLEQVEWALKMQIIQGNWLTSNNFRAAHRERKDDEISALWHFALNVTYMIVRTHFGVAVTNPTSLAAHKGLLHRTWDANKPNYATAKSLIRHSLIARLLCSAKNAEDDWHAHEVYFMCDALLFLVFEHAVSTADAGIVLRVLKYWVLSFWGASQHNYAHKCVKVLVRWKYKLSNALRAALERAWFVNRWGEPGRWIAADLYLEQCNFWVKRVFIASGNGVTIEYIMRKGLACIEAFRNMSHLMAHLFGDLDQHRHLKEVAFYEDMHVLVQDMTNQKLHILAPKQHFVPQMKKKKGGQACSAIVDSMVLGVEIWQNSKFDDYVHTMAWDPEGGYPIGQETDGHHETRYVMDTAFDNCNTNVLEIDKYVDLHGDESTSRKDSLTGIGALGGGDEFATGTEAF
ncbi:hypothetical protein V8D89_006634 [Ganoderma adspersum]